MILIMMDMTDEDEDTVFSKLLALSSRDWSETFFEMFSYLTNKGFGILQHIKLYINIKCEKQTRNKTYIIQWHKKL